MKVSRNLADVITAVIIVAILYVLVRPTSGGPALITQITNAFVAIVRNAADLATPEKSGGLLGNLGNQLQQFVDNLKPNKASGGSNG